MVIGLGNPDRGDDAVGALVVRALAGRVAAEVVLRERTGDMLSLLDDWEGFAAVICIDAAAPAGAPGRIHRLDPAVDVLERDFAFASSHAYGLAEAVALARKLDLLPRDLVIYAVEGVGFDAGASLTDPVAAAVGPTAERVLAELARLHQPGEIAHA